MIFASVDPGKEGALVIGRTCLSALEIPKFYTLPYIGSEVDGVTIAEILTSHGVEALVIEKAQPMAKGGRRQGVSSTAATVGNQREIVGVAKGLGIPVYQVHPQTWKAVVLKGTTKDKAAAISFVRQAFPGVPLVFGSKRVPHDGVADAICIAVYAVRELIERTGGR